MNLILSQTIFEQLIAHAIREQPRECCGLLGGLSSPYQMIAQSHYPLRNQAAHPETQFFASPQDLFAAMKVMRTRHEELLAIYHSHPTTPPYPSSTDLAMAFYPQALLLIIGLSPIQTMRAFQIYGQKLNEVTTIIVS